MANPIIKEAEEALKKLSEERQAREFARARDMWDMDMASVRKYEREEGIEKGREEGLEKGLEKGREEGLEKGLKEGLKQSARLMFKSGIELAKIAKILEVPDDELEEWIKD